MPDISIIDPSVHAAPKSYTITGSQEIVLKGVSASFDGTGAVSSFVPAVQILTPAGVVVGTYVLGETLAAGASADVAWFPGVNQTQAVVPVGQVRLVYDYTVTGSSKTYIDTALDGPFAGSFPSNLNYLEIFVSGRTTGASKIDDVSFQFNGDTGNNYTRAFLASSSTGSPGQGHTVNAAIFEGVLPGANAQSNVSGLCRFFVPNYTNTTFYKVCEFTAWGSDTTTTGGTPTTFPFQVGLETALWASTAALTSIKVFCTGDIDVAGNLDIGTRLTAWAR